MKHLTLPLLIALFMSMNFQSPGQNIDLDSGLVAFYPFNKKAKDESGNENHGKLHHVNKEKDVDGTPKGSYYWNHKKDYIEVPVNINPVNMPQASICLWVWVKTFQSEINLITNDDSDGDRKIYCKKVNNRWLWGCSDGQDGFIGKTPMKLKEWTFIVAVYDQDSKMAHIYVNGEKTSGKANVDMGTDLAYIGSVPNYRGMRTKSFRARIDEVRIYDRILNPAEIDSLQNLKVPEIDEKEQQKKDYFYVVEPEKLSVRAQPGINSQQISVLKKNDTLLSHETVKSSGAQYDDWLKIDLDGQTGYVSLDYLDKQDAGDKEMSEFERYIQDKMSWMNWEFWVAMLVLLLIGLFGSIKFRNIDRLLSRFSVTSYEGRAVFPMVMLYLAIGSAVVMILWQSKVEYYLFENFAWLPVGYGFGPWLMWLMMVIAAGSFIFTFIQSFYKASYIHAILRIVLQLIFGAFLFFGTFIISIALFFIAFAILFALLLLSGLYTRYYVVREY